MSGSETRSNPVLKWLENNTDLAKKKAIVRAAFVKHRINTMEVLTDLSDRAA